MFGRKQHFVVALLILLFFNALANATTVGFRPPVDYPAGTAPRGIVVADFNGDGKMDLAVGDYGGPNTGDDGGVKLFLGKGDGTFHSATSIVVGKNPCLSGSCLVAADFNGDGSLDLAVADNDNRVSVLLGRGDGTFQPHVDYVVSRRADSLLLGDLNGDHHPDLILLAFDSWVGTLLGNGDGTFQDEVVHSTGSAPTGLTVFDVNNDGMLDLVMTAGNQGIETMFGNGDGTFKAGVFCTCGAQEFITPYGPTEGDFNEDGKMDLAVDFFDDYNKIHNQHSNEEMVLLGNGDGTFTPHGTRLHSSGLLGFGGVVSDLNQDGHLDLAIAFHPLVGMFADGSGIFTVANFASEGLATSIAAADINGDHFPDVIVTNFGLGTISVLLNTAQPVAMLRLGWSGNGYGTVTSSPPGINCQRSINCEPPFDAAPFDIGTAVSLSETAADGSTFGGWSGACSGTGACNLVMNADQSVTATFNSPDFLLSGTAPAAIVAGKSAASTVSITSVDAFNSTVQLTCSVDPAPALSPTCSINPTAATPAANGSASSTLTIYSTAPTVAAVQPAALGWLYALWLPVGGLTWMGIGLASKAPRNRMLPVLVLCVVLAAAFSLVSCGGGTRVADPHRTGGTPPGTYTITITGASSGSLEHSTTVMLTVQ